MIRTVARRYATPSRVTLVLPDDNGDELKRTGPKAGRPKKPRDPEAA